MFGTIWIIPFLPLLSFLILAITGKRWSEKTVSILGVGSVGISALFTVLIGIQFLTNPPPGHFVVQTLWSWMEVGSLTPAIAFHLDALSLVFCFVVTFVGFIIHLYSSEFMEEDEGFSRFFAYMNLFVGSMLILVLADNLVLLYLGWEGVGLCSYLLIGFWYKDPQNGYAARKAFVVTRVGDTAMAIGLFLLFTSFGTLHIDTLLDAASQNWATGTTMAVLASALLLGGAVGKSAQLPLQTWLPDAMAGPTPVSALIHAATMVTAGVYLIARTNVIFMLAPATQLAVAIIGAATLLIAGFAALTQVDIKRVLAYSTISQIGYMFLALGVGAWSAAILHFMTHAFFKALLFLAAGVVILAMHHEHNMFKMGGLRKELPITFWTFLIGSASLAALPIVTAGFYSKDLILWYAWAGEQGNFWLWLAGFAGAFITAIYTFRMVFVTFYGKRKSEISHKPGKRMLIPLVILAVFSIIGGLVETPHTLGHIQLFSKMLENVLPSTGILHSGISEELILQIVTALLALLGIYLAYYLWLKKFSLVQKITQVKLLATSQRFFFSGWGFDWLYDRLFVFPAVWLARINRRDFIDLFYDGIADANRYFHQELRKTQSGQIRWYALGILIGALITLTIVVFI
ncbi:MAG: NADH-quinone oxidoreductase subunit L [Calditrichaeota bacterium]|nr:NADH-quinone oxidoreductase subunit L [Calditrichota bacterium]RQV98091.1 MAG: NADH-quinone oxidoreductase subunit L [Calditrichota bacterium]